MRRILLRSLLLGGLLAGQSACGYVVHVVQQVEVDGVVVETIDETHDAPVTLTTSDAVSRSGYTFTHWSTSAVQEFAGRDPWGRAYEQVSFTVYEPMTNTAHYVREDLDDDGDGMPDGVELYWYGNLDQTRDSDTDGDGIGFAAELAGGFNPHFSDAWKRGVVGKSVTLPSHRVLMRSDPADILMSKSSQLVVENTYFTSPKFDPEESHFSHWLKDGVKQDGSYGEPLQRVKFQMSTNDVELVAVCKTYQLIKRCVPDGTLLATTTNRLLRGESVSTPSCSPWSSLFAYWTVNGVEQRDAFGRAIDRVSFEMPANDVEVIAVCEEDETVRAALYWYGDDMVGWESDTDGDGYTLQEEFALGLNPHFKDEYVGGIKSASRKPQFFQYTVRCEPEGILFATTIENVCPGIVKTTAAYQPTNSRFA